MQSDSHLQRFRSNLLYLSKGQITVPLKWKSNKYYIFRQCDCP